jgi:hypothetical protein
VGVTGYDVYQGASLKGTSGTTYTATGLTAATCLYTIKDAAGIHQLPVNCKCNLLQLLRLSIVHHKEIVQ